MKYILIIIAALFPNLLFSQSVNQNQVKKLTLTETIEIAADSSLASFKAKNLYLSGYWQYRTFKAERLPYVSLDMNPFSYNSRLGYSQQLF